MDDNWIFEVRDNVFLFFGDHVELADGWWFSIGSKAYGPFATEQEAFDGAGAACASDPTAGLNFVWCPTDEPLPVH